MSMEQIMRKINVLELNIIRQQILSENSKALETAAKGREDALRKLNDKNWDRISSTIDLALLEHGLTIDEIQSIYARVSEITPKLEGNLFSNLEVSKRFIILDADEHKDLIEELLECKCKGCTVQFSSCTLHDKLQRRKIPYYDLPKNIKDTRLCRYSHK